MNEAEVSQRYVKQAEMSRSGRGVIMSALLTTIIIHSSLFIIHYSLNKKGGQRFPSTHRVGRNS